jgi:hypothetical protein
MINYTISDFFGLFFVGLPTLVFATTILFWGLRQIFDNFFKDPTEGTIFHHHYHHKSPRDL